MSLRPTTATGALILQSYLDRLLAEIPGSQPAVTHPDANPSETSDVALDEDPAPSADAHHEWRDTPFQAVLFCVHAVRLAAPLIRLHGVVPWNEALSDLPNTPDWFLGVCAYRDQNVRVVDTSVLILQGQNLDVERRHQHIILLDVGRWGLTCDAVSEVLTLTPDAVQWRTGHGSRPWLAGTLRDKLCALLDVDALAAMLERREDCRRI
ncbi:MAG: chemotaxis protein CheW [Gammaproteobacteria bacterium]|nr:chemotaxis protein CheW [Gammaproteobacteria bacterium]